MKIKLSKFVVVVFAFVLITSVFSGCTSDTAASPDPAPTANATQVTIGFGDVMDDFADQDLISNYNTPWSVINDSDKGGTSVVHSFDVLASGDIGYDYALRLSGTASCDIQSGSYYTLGTVGGSGYYKVSCDFGAGGADLSNFGTVDMIYFSMKETSATGNIRARAYIFDSSGRYIYGNTVLFTTSWSLYNFYLDTSSVPTGASYTASDVLSDARRLEVIIHATDTLYSKFTFEVLMDNFKFGLD